LKKKGIASRLKSDNAKRNSTNSIFQTRTLNVGTPDLQQLVSAMGAWYHELLLQNLNKSDGDAPKSKFPKRRIAIFDEPAAVAGSASGGAPKALVPLPGVDAVTQFVDIVVSAGELAPQSIIMAVAYIDRVALKLELYGGNWRRVVLSSLILGCKVWEEHPVYNTDFGDVLPTGVSGPLLGKMEKQLLQLMKFSVGLTGQEYAKYYFALRDLSPLAESLSAQPLTDEQLSKLEKCSDAKSKEWAKASKGSRAVQSATFAGAKGHRRAPNVRVKDATDVE